MEDFNKQEFSPLAKDQNWEEIIRKVLEYAFLKGHIAKEEILKMV